MGDDSQGIRRRRGPDGRVAADDQDGIKAAAIRASSNVPARSRKGREAAARLHHSYSFTDMPEYLADNEFILSSYRRAGSTVLQSIVSAFGLHNETVNIWTHALGFMLFVTLAVYLVFHPPTPLALSADRLDHVWGRVQDRFAGVRGSLGTTLDAGLHSMQGGLHTLQQGLSDNLQALEGRLAGVQQGLSDNLQALEGRVQQGVAALEEGMASGVAALEGRMQQGVAALTGELAELLPGRLRQLPGSIQAGSLQLADALRAYVQQQLEPVLQWPTPRWPVYVYLAGAMTCLLVSTTAHILGCCQMHISAVLWRFDYTGIAVLIVASFVPAIYYSFLCQPRWRTFYLLTTSLMGLATICVSLMSRFNAKEYRTFRAWLYVSLGLWGVVPICHQVALHSGVWAVTAALKLDLAMGFFYLFGAFLFASQIPERWLPGRFDLLGASHQLFHMCVVIAAYIHYRAIMILLEWRDASGGCALPITEGPVPTILAQLQQNGAQLLSVDQVVQNLSMHLQNYIVSSPAPAATVT